MKVLLDENLPAPMAGLLPKHEVRTAAEMGWSGIKNGKLLTLVEAAGFDVFLTGDKSLEHQNIIERLPFGVAILSTTNWPVLRRNLALVNAGIEACVPGTARLVECGGFTQKRRRKPPASSP